MRGLPALARSKRQDRPVKKKYERAAELAYWYGIQPRGEPAEIEVGLWANLRRVQAQGRIDRGDYCQTDPQGVFELYLAAYGQRELASKAGVRAAELLIEAKTARQK